MATRSSKSGGQVTMVDIAERCGVSVFTVSHALRSDSKKVSEETRKRICAVAKEMGYDPSRNQAARRMVLQRHGTPLKNRDIGVALPIKTELTPYYAKMLDGIVHVIGEHSYGLHLTRFDNPKDGTMPAECSRGEVDGLISVQSTGWFSQWVKRLRNEPNFGPRPIVGLIDPIPGCSSVHADDFQAGYIAGCHLLELGNRYILHDLQTEHDVRHGLAASAEAVHTKRLQGIEQAYREHGLDPAEYTRTVLTPHNDAETEPHGSNLVRVVRENPRFTAICAQNDCSAVAIWSVLCAAGLRIPEDISLIGFDDTEPIRSSSTGQNVLTTVRMPLFEIGQEGARFLLRAIEEENYNAMNITLPTSLVVRHSTSTPRIRK